jgi:hypothetical protein
MLVWSNILLHSKTGKKNVIFTNFWRKFQVARVPRCFDNYNINEWVGYGVWHFSCTYHKMRFLVSAITLYSIFNLFVVGGTSQAMACVYLWPPTQYQVKGLNQVDQDAHKLKGWSSGAPTIHMLSCIWYLLLTLHGFSLVEKSSLWKVRIIPTKWSYITPTELLWSLLSGHNTNFSPIIRNGYCKLLGPSRYKVS